MKNLKLTKEELRDYFKHMLQQMDSTYIAADLKEQRDTIISFLKVCEPGDTITVIPSPVKEDPYPY